MIKSVLNDSFFYILISNKNAFKARAKFVIGLHFTCCFQSHGNISLTRTRIEKSTQHFHLHHVMLC